MGLPRSAHAAGASLPLGLDGSGLQTCGGESPSYGQSFSVTLSTANQNDVLIVWISVSRSYSVVSVTDNNLLPWTLRERVDNRATSGYEYFATWTGSGFEDITVNFSGGYYPFCSIVAFGIAGADYVNPFDSNPSVPSSASGVWIQGGGFVPQQESSITLSTDNSNDMLLGLVTTQNYNSYNPGPGFACLAGTCDGIGTANTFAEYNVVTSSESNYPISVSTDGSGSWSMIGDAVEGPADGPSFSFTNEVASYVVQAGTSASSTITLTSINGFSGNISLSSTVTPTQCAPCQQKFNLGATVRTTSAYLSPGGYATTVLTVTTSGSTPAGQYTVTIAGTSGSQISTSFPLTVYVPNFSVVSDPGHLIVDRGQNSSSTVTVTSNYGFRGQVSLSVHVYSTWTNGPVLSLQDSVLQLSGSDASTTLNISTDGNTTMGPYDVRVTGSSGSMTSSFDISLIVGAPELDGVGSGIPVLFGCNCGAQSLSTSQGGDVIIVIVECNSSQTACSTIIDSNGLTFNARVVSPTISEYYAWAPQQLNSDNITVVFNSQGCCSQMQTMAIAGASPGMIFDQDPSAPAVAPCPTFGSQPCSGSISTSGRDFIIGATVINDAGACTTLPPGFAQVAPLGGHLDLDYKISAAAQGNLTFTCAGSDPQTVLVDAVALAPPSSSAFALTFQGYDWDGAGEENVTLNGQLMASLPATNSPQNGGNWANFSLNTNAIVQGTNTLTFTHANWDCATSDNVQNLQVSGGSSVVYSNSASLPLSCTHSLTYTFTV